MNGRLKANQRAREHRPLFVQPPAERTSDYYGVNVFNRTAMRKFLAEDIRRRIYESRESGTSLSKDVAEEVAKGMKEWAIGLGATHYTHWFQPLTGGTAEKHDSFATPHGYDGTMEEFTGSVLSQQESDASSFPNGGLRNTFEARGYTAWDSSSPAFVIKDTLFIPTIFIAYTKEALDNKTPLLRSSIAISKAATEVMRFFDEATVRTLPQLGWEQEYFLVDRSLFEARPDLILTGRTLFGRTFVTGQSTVQHYWGAIPERVLGFMQDLEFESYKLGIPLKTRHNEAAPNQFELAPVYEEMNLAVDHNLAVILLMETIARKHDFKVLFHEKPFKGINGSGKHCNWSLLTDRGVNVFAPGKSDGDNLRFLAFLVVTLKAVHRNNALLKASVASASNSYRLGSSEAPPAIISVFVGEQIESVLDNLERDREAGSMRAKRSFTLNVPEIPELSIDNTDRNRTSPFAFTGNRFEFRAVGSSDNCAKAMSVLNTVVAYELTQFKRDVDSRIKDGSDRYEAIMDCIISYYKDSRRICYNGNGYSDEWKAEAGRRGLDCETSAPLMLDSFLSEQSMRIFSEMNVLSPVELGARNEVFWDSYMKKVSIEAKVIADLSMNHVIPAAIRYQSMLMDNVLKLKDLFPVKEFKGMTRYQIDVIGRISEHIDGIRELAQGLGRAHGEMAAIGSAREAAIACHDSMIPYIDGIRVHLDALEKVVDDDMWPLPKYRELLFINRCVSCPDLPAVR